MFSDAEEESNAILPRPRPDAFLDSDEDSESVVRTTRGRRANRIDSSEDETPPSTASASLVRQLSSEAKTLIEETYRAVWTEFYNWEPSHCTQTLRSLAAETPSQATASDYGLEDSDWCLETHSSGTVGSSEHQFDVWQWTDAGTVRRLTTPPAITVVAEEDATPHPRYEACAPSDCNIDPMTSATKPCCTFIKYAGQPGFDERGFLSVFHSVGWQGQLWRDPDRRIIAFTTIHRLTSWAGGGPVPPIPIYVEDIEESQIFYQSQGRPISTVEAVTVTIPDILFKLRQRDELMWPGYTSGRDSMYTYTPIWRDPAKSGHRGKLFALSSSLCPNLDCLGAECFTHPYPTGWDNDTVREGGITNEEMLEKVARQPCGDKCFIELHSDEISNSINWEVEPEVKELDAMLQLAPNILPCSLCSLFPETDCYKIFARRDQVIQKYEPSRSRQKRPNRFLDDQGKELAFTVPVRCRHKGPCGPHSIPACECYQRNLHCRRNCQCSDRCVRRYQGCKCAGADNTCGAHNSRCECRQVKRECDPELCKQHGTFARRQKGKATKKVPLKCSNSDYQRPSRVSLVVQAGSYGLGTFAGQNIPRNTFLGCYVGEIYWAQESTHREKEYRYSGLNYSFRHNRHQFIDALSAGNETRFINHAEMGNVAAEIRLVNGEQKIGFLAIKSIKRGDELLFDYGKDYWGKGGQMET